MAGYGTFGDSRRRRRHQASWRMVRFLFGLVAVLGVGIYGYQVGISAGHARSAQLEADLMRLQRANLELRDRIAVVDQRSEEAEATLEDLRQRFAAEIPAGEVADLLEQVRSQLGAGVAPERLAFLIEAAGLDACQSAPVTKRFMPRTPISTGPRSFVRFGDRITVTGEGESVRNEAGLPEAWYDPARPVRLEFRLLDGSSTSIEGIVPFTHQIVVDGKEYRFSAVQGDRRFLDMTAQACPLPDPGDGLTNDAAGILESHDGRPDPDFLTD
jgi:ABC-type cobalt transport system substrate-binding protein